MVFGYAGYDQAIKFSAVPVEGLTAGYPGKQPEVSVSAMVFDVPSGIVLNR